MRRLQLFFRGFGVGDIRCDQLGGGLVGLALGLLELSELGILREKLHVDSHGLRIEDFAAPARDDEAAPLRRLQQATPLQIDLRPRHPIGKASLTSARQQLVQLGLCELEFGAQTAAGIREDVLFAITSEAQQRQHDGLEIRNWPVLPLCARRESTSPARAAA